MCKVSVLVPVYNVKKYLAQCLDSLTAQTCDSIEFICIDDGSTDGSEKILDAYVEKDARFHVIHKANSGYGASMNVGLRAAQGEYIGIVEPDDFADAGMFAALLDAAEVSQAEVVKSNYFLYTTKDGDDFQEMLRGCPYREVCSVATVPKLFQTDAFVWTSLYRKTFLEKNHLCFRETPGASFQDVGFSMKVLLCCKRMYLLPEGYLHYRVDNMGSSFHQMARKYLHYHGEFAGFWQFAHERPAEEQKLAAPITFNIWRIYQVNCWPVVSWDDRAHYLARLIREFQTLEVEGFLRETDWPADAWQKLQRLLQHPKESVLACAQEAQEQRLRVAGFLHCLHEAPNVYLYGAGQVAKGLLAWLQQHDIQPTGLLVSTLEGNPSAIGGVPVYVLDDSPTDREHDIVVIAVTPRKPEIQQEIFCALSQAGYRNVLVLTRELQEALSRA